MGKEQLDGEVVIRQKGRGEGEESCEQALVEPYFETVSLGF